MPAFRMLSTECWITDLPCSSSRTFGRSDFIRVPLPPARIIARTPRFSAFIRTPSSVLNHYVRCCASGGGEEMLEQQENEVDQQSQTHAKRETDQKPEEAPASSTAEDDYEQAFASP